MSVWCQQETHAPQQFNSLFDHLVGGGEQHRRQAERFGCFRVDDELEFIGSLDRQLAGFRAIGQAMGIDSRLTIDIDEIETP